MREDDEDSDDDGSDEEIDESLVKKTKSYFYGRHFFCLCVNKGKGIFSFIH